MGLNKKYKKIIYQADFIFLSMRLIDNQVEFLAKFSIEIGPEKYAK